MERPPSRMRKGIHHVYEEHSSSCCRFRSCKGIKYERFIKNCLSSSCLLKTNIQEPQDAWEAVTAPVAAFTSAADVCFHHFSRDGRWHNTWNLSRYVMETSSWSSNSEKNDKGKQFADIVSLQPMVPGIHGKLWPTLNSLPFLLFQI